MNTPLMTSAESIDTSFNFRSDTPKDRDPDALSPTLRRYHQFLWSKPLPGGAAFELVTNTPGAYLHHKSAIGEFFLSSDSVIPTFRKETRLSPIFDQIPAEERDQFLKNTYTIGGMMVFPGNTIGRAMTINGARGFHPRVKDRFDYTVECIRRHYRDETSPLREVLARYANFFSVFGDFRGYADFFLLQDLVSEDYEDVRFFTPFTDFKPYPLPSSVDEYREYRQNAEAFVEARNQRIAKCAEAQGRCVAPLESGRLTIA